VKPNSEQHHNFCPESLRSIGFSFFFSSQDIENTNSLKRK
jgi:hypothetical protein